MAQGEVVEKIKKRSTGFLDVSLGRFERADDLYECVGEELEAAEAVDGDFERADDELEALEEEEYWPVVDDWLCYAEQLLDVLKKIRRAKARIRLVEGAYPAWARKAALRKLREELSSLQRLSALLSYKLEASCRIRSCASCRFINICAGGKKLKAKKPRRYL